MSATPPPDQARTDTEQTPHRPAAKQGEPTRKQRTGDRVPDGNGPRAKFSQLLPYLAEHRGILGFVIVLSILGAGASLAQPLLVGQVIALVEQNQPLGSLVWLLILIVVVSALLSSFQHYLLQRTGEGVVLSSRRHLVSRLLRLPISEFDSRRTGDLVSRVGSDTTLLRAVLTQGLVEAVGGVVTFIGALIAMFILDATLLGLTLLVVAVAAAAVLGLGQRIRAASRRAQEQVGALTASVERAISAVRTVRAANATERELKAIDRDATAAWQAGISVAKISAVVMPIAGIAMQVSFLVVLGVGGYRVASGAISVADLVAFIMFLFLMILPLGQAFGAVSAVNQALGALGRIQEIIQLPSEDEADARLGAEAQALATSGADAAPDATAAATVHGQDAAAAASADIAVEFDAVEFGYPDTAHRTEQEKILAEALADEDAEAAPAGERTVLRGVSFQALRGQRTALVGPSGAGKSTILALIERFYDADAGAVRFGGQDVRTLDRQWLRSRIGYVEQDAPVLAGTLRDNLLLASPEADDEACRAVLEQVNLTGVLERDPAGLDAQVGEDGVMLSGGERQRLAIARTLLAAPPLLLLDESTSSLDGLNEQRLKAAIDTVAVDRTLIVIAHRLSTVIDSDRIVVLDQGHVAGVGTHRELMKSTPLYRELAEHQLLS